MRALMVLVLLVLSACELQPSPRLQPEGVGGLSVQPRALELSVEPATEGVHLVNPRFDQGLLAFDIAVEGAREVLGLALRLSVDGGRFVRAQPAQTWTVARFEATPSGAVGVWSQHGDSTLTLQGVIGTLWLEPRGPGAVGFEPQRSGLFDAAGQPVAMPWAGARWR